MTLLIVTTFCLGPRYEFHDYYLEGRAVPRLAARKVWALPQTTVKRQVKWAPCEVWLSLRGY